MEINIKEFPEESVVFFVEKKGIQWNVKFGTVDDHYVQEICLTLYELAEDRLINGIPVDDFVTPTKWRKLPKGWTYSTELFTVTRTDVRKRSLNYDFKNPEDILRAIKDGILVRADFKDYSKIEAEITKENGWRIVRNFSISDFRPVFISLPFYEVYKTFDEAAEVVKAHRDELERQSNLSDLEWSIEQIDKEIDRWAGMNGISEDDKQKMRERIMALDNLEEVEVTCKSASLMWKYDKEKRWKDLS